MSTAAYPFLAIGISCWKMSVILKKKKKIKIKVSKLWVKSNEKIFNIHNQIYSLYSLNQNKTNEKQLI